MRLLNLYIGKTVLYSIITVLLVLIGLDVCFAFLAELGDVKNNYRAPQALAFIGLTVPRRIYEFIPVATLIGCLIGLGSLASTSELTVVRAAGISVFRIVLAAARPVLLVVGMGLLLGQVVVPNTEQFAQSEKARHLYLGEKLPTREGYWYRENDQFIHIQVVQPNGIMYGISRFVFNDSHHLIRSDYAERAEYQGDHWVLYNLRQTEMFADYTKATDFESLSWSDTAITPDVMAILVLKPDYLSITELHRYASYLKSQELNSQSYFYSFWKKLLQPATTLVMVLIAISFIFGPLRSVSMGQRIMAGVVTGLLFHYAQQFLGQITIIFNVAPLVAALLPNALALLVGLYLLRRV